MNITNLIAMTFRLFHNSVIFWRVLHVWKQKCC